MRLLLILIVSASLFACGDDDPPDEPMQSQSDNPQDDPTYQCQASEQLPCESSVDSSKQCCPISAEPSVDCSMIGGTMAPTCASVCDAPADSFEPLVRNDDGCWVWEGQTEAPIPVTEF